MGRFSLPSVVPRLLTRDLILRPITEADVDSYFELCSDARVMRGWGTSAHRTKEETLNLIRFLETQLRQCSLLRWGIALREDEARLIGDVGYWRFVPVRFRGELGAKLLPEHWKKSYMSQALERAIQSGFEDLGLNSVEGNIEIDNVASLRLVEKLGFVKEGLVRQHTYSSIKGHFVDTALFSIIKSEWKPVFNV